MARKYLDINDFNGAIAVLENYLDGAVADYEDEQVEHSDIIDSCIETILTIYGLCNPWLLLGGNEYEERMRKAKEERIKKYGSLQVSK